VSVCGAQYCGVAVAQTKSGRWVHVDEVDSEVPWHEVVVAEAEAYVASVVAYENLRSAATDLLTHHATFHPSADCPWSERVFRALQG